MVTCPKCNETMKIQNKTIAFPERDEFICEDCQVKRYRYEGTEYEMPTDPKHKEITKCQNSKP